VSVSADKTELDFKYLIVMLRDDTATQAEKTLATECADDVEGLKGANLDFHKKILASLERSRTCFGPSL
jgi:hypothetical protein